MCEVAVCKGDVGGHARACSRVCQCECIGEVCKRRNTQVCVGRMEFERESATTTATIERQRPSSGRSFNGDRAGFTRRRACGPCRATHETPTCSAAGVRPGPGTPAVDVADPADGQRSGWVDEFGRTGSLRGHVCETLRGLRGVFCSQSARRRLRAGRAHVLAWRSPRIARFVFF